MLTSKGTILKYRTFLVLGENYYTVLFIKIKRTLDKRFVSSVVIAIVRGIPIFLMQFPAVHSRLHWRASHVCLKVSDS